MFSWLAKIVRDLSEILAEIRLRATVLDEAGTKDQNTRRNPSRLRGFVTLQSDGDRRTETLGCLWVSTMDKASTSSEPLASLLEHLGIQLRTDSREPQQTESTESSDDTKGSSRIVDITHLVAGATFVIGGHPPKPHPEKK